MEYPIIKLPPDLSKDVLIMEPKEVQIYFDWFMSVKDERLKKLYGFIFKHPLELSSSKLQSIYYFLKENIKARQLTSKEIQTKKNRLPEQIKNLHKVSNYEFIEPTYSIIFDVGIYFGELLISEIPNLIWNPELNKKMVYYGRPILIKSGVKADLNPQWILQTLTMQIYENRAKEDKLVELYATWKKIFNQ